MRLIAFSIALVFLLPGVAEAGKKKKKDDGAVKEAGWQPVGPNGGSCWYPPDWSELTAGPKRMAWQETRDAIMSQWKGERDDGVTFKEKVIIDNETVMLAKADRVEQVAAENLEHCEKAMKGAGTDAWAAWLLATPGKLTVGECPYPPMDYTLYDYLSINNEWQIPVNVCAGDKVILHGTPADYYQLSNGGPWINVSGDTSNPDTNGLPCTLEGCIRGMLIMRYKTDTGIEQILPVGETAEFLAPEHGIIHVMINDDTWTDNNYKVERGLEHHTGIEYKPAGG